MKSSKRLPLSLVALMLVVLFANSAVFAAPVLPRILNFVTSGTGTAGYQIASGAATVLSKHLAMEVKVVPTTGSRETFPMFITEEGDLGANSSFDCREAWLAGPTLKEFQRGKRAPIQLLISGAPNLGGVTVAADSGIMTGADLKGKRYVGIYAGSDSITKLAHAALANFGLRPDDVRMISVPNVQDGVTAIIEKRADATGSSVIGMAALQELDMTRGARFLSFNSSPEAVKRFTDIYPALATRVEPRKGVVGVKEPIYLMEYDTYLYGNKNLTEDTVYQIVKTLWDYNKELASISKRLSDWTTDRFVTRNAAIPYHSGAIKFYKEKGIWTNENERRQQDLLTQ